MRNKDPMPSHRSKAAICCCKSNGSKVPLCRRSRLRNAAQCTNGRFSSCSAACFSGQLGRPICCISLIGNLDMSAVAYFVEKLLLIGGLFAGSISLSMQGIDGDDGSEARGARRVVL